MTTAVLLSLVGAYGVFLVVTSRLFGWKGLGIGPPRNDRSVGADAGPPSRNRREVAVATAFAFVGVTGVVVAVFGAVLPAVAVGAGAALWPARAEQRRRSRCRRQAAEAWPSLLEEIGVLAGSLGTSIPQALFEVGHRSPPELRPAFEAASRHWLMSTDLAESLAVLTAELADPTADAACETLLVAHELGGSDLPKRLAALIEDRIADLEGRRDAAARQAGACFARRFVLLVPAGMALAGLSIGDGRAAYQSGGGQTLAMAGVGLVAACWVWSGRIMHLPLEERVFGG